MPDSQMPYDSTPTPALRLLPSVAVCVLGLLVVGCGDLLTSSADPGPARFSLALSFTEEVTAGGPREAYAQANRVLIRLTREGSPPLEVARAFDATADESRIPFAVDLSRDEETASLFVELLVGESPLFRGQSTIALRPGRTVEVEITLTPVPASVRIAGPPEVVFESLGARTPLSAFALFVTGDTIPGLALSWSSSAAAVANVDDQGVVTARGEGETTVVARHGELSDAVSVRVRQAVASLTLQPASASLQVGESIQLQMQARDPGGSLIVGRSASSWSSSDPSLVEVTGDGVVTARRAGGAVITAVLEGIQAQASIQVVLRPTIALSSSSLTMTGLARIARSELRTVFVTNGREGELSGLSVVGIQYGEAAGGWLDASLNSATAPAVLNILTSTGNLEEGEYSAVVMVGSPMAENSPQAVQVNLIVAAPGRIQLNPESLYLSSTGSSPATRVVEVENVGEGIVGSLEVGPIEYGSGGSGWLSASLPATVAPATLHLTATAGGMPDGIYTATVPISSATADNSPQWVQVTFEVGGDRCLEYVGTISLGETVSGALDYGDCELWEEGPYSQRWRLLLEESTTVEVLLSSDAFAPRVEVTNLAGDTLAFGSGAVEVPAVVVTTLPPGVFNLKLYGNPGEIGNYQLAVDAVSECPVTGVIGVGDEVGGALTTADCTFDEFSTFAQLWRLDIAESDVVQIGLYSTAFPPLFVLVDADDNWVEVAYPDEEPYDFEAWAVVTLGPGTYFIWVMSESPGGTGSYQLWTWSSMGS